MIPSIFDYSDYRKFIKDFQQMKSGINSAFSFRYFVKKAGINSSSFYPQVIKGRRNLTKNTIFKTCIALGLKDLEAEYFENLVFFNQAKTVKDKNFFFEKLVEKQKLKNVKKIQDNQYEYFSAWYHCIIREAAAMTEWKNDYAALGRFLNPPVPAEQVQASVDLLVTLGFLTKDGGRYVQSEPLLKTEGDSDFRTHRITHYQIEVLKLAIEAYDRWKPEKRLTSATTFSFSDKNYNRFVEILRECRLQLMKLAMNDEKANQVYILSMNFFPMTQVLKQ